MALLKKKRFLDVYMKGVDIMTMFHGDIHSVCLCNDNQTNWMHIGDSLNGQTVKRFKEMQTLEGAPIYSEYTLEGDDGLIAKFENFVVKETKVRGKLKAIALNGQTYEVGKKVNGREIMAIHKYIEYPPTARIVHLVPMNSSMANIKHMQPDAMEIWYDPFEPF